MHISLNNDNKKDEDADLKKSHGLIGWDCRIHRLHLYRGVRLQQTVSWIYDTKISEEEASAFELCVNVYYNILIVITLR